MIKTLTSISILFLSLSVYAGTADIVAKVGEEAISSATLDKRIELMVKSSGKPDTLSARQEIADKALQNLINEKLQKKFANQFNVSIKDAEVNNAFAELAKMNRKTPQEFAETLVKENVSLAATLDNLRAQVLWQKILAAKVRPLVSVSDDEVNARYNELKSEITGREIEVFEILITVSGTKEDTKLIVNELYKKADTSTKFMRIAKEFSESPTAPKGGRLGFINEERLSKKLKDIVGNVARNTTTRPVYDNDLDAYRLIRIGEVKNLSSNLTKNKVKEKILLQKMKREGEKFMNELYNETYVEVRG